MPAGGCIRLWAGPNLGHAGETAAPKANLAVLRPEEDPPPPNLWNNRPGCALSHVRAVLSKASSEGVRGCDEMEMENHRQDRHPGMGRSLGGGGCTAGIAGSTGYYLGHFPCPLATCSSQGEGQLLEQAMHTSRWPNATQVGFLLTSQPRQAPQLAGVFCMWLFRDPGPCPPGACPPPEPQCPLCAAGGSGKRELGRTWPEAEFDVCPSHALSLSKELGGGLWAGGPPGDSLIRRRKPSAVVIEAERKGY